MELKSNMVHYEIYEGVAYITLADISSGNALKPVLLEQLSQALQQANCDETCRVIVILAEGSSFCKGLDLEWAFADTEERQFKTTDFKPFIDCLKCICNSSRPVIAGVTGQVTGGGLGLVAACDIILASNQVNFILSEVIVGMIPALITPFLLRRLSLAQIRYLTLSSRKFSAEEAKTFGLVDEVVNDALQPVLDKQLQRLLRSSPKALAESKRYFEKLSGDSLDQNLNIALDTLVTWLSQAEVVAGIRDFTEGFAPPWFQNIKNVQVFTTNHK